MGLLKIVQGPLAIQSRHVISMGWASSVQHMTQLAPQHMLGLTHGGHQDQPRPNQGKPIVLNVETSTTYERSHWFFPFSRYEIRKMDRHCHKTMFQI